MIEYDRSVDLLTFGTIDYYHPIADMMCYGNGMINADKPGETTVRDTRQFDNGVLFSPTTTYIYTEP